jgi:cytidylate kinase
LENNASIEKILNEKKCLDVVQTVNKNLAGKGRIVIVGRGGQAILKNKVNVIHVRIIALYGIRIARVIKLCRATREQALKAIEENDKAISEYLQRFYSINWDDPANYHMVLNTAIMVSDTACSYGQKVCIL